MIFVNDPFISVLPVLHPICILTSYHGALLCLIPEAAFYCSRSRFYLPPLDSCDIPQDIFCNNQFILYYPSSTVLLARYHRTPDVEVTFTVNSWFPSWVEKVGDWLAYPLGW